MRTQGLVMLGLMAALVAAVVSCAGGEDDPGVGTVEAELAWGHQCDGVRCFALPQCDEGQHAVYTPNDCCGHCVGPDQWSPHCEGILCAAVMCPAGQQRVYHPGTCCGVCKPEPQGPPGDDCGISSCGKDERCCCPTTGSCSSESGICPAVLCPAPV